MKNGFTIVLVLLGIFFAYRYFQEPASEEMRMVQEIADRFQEAVKQFRQAGRGAAIGGIDTSAGAGDAIERIEDLRLELSELRDALEEEDALSKADDLMERIRAFQRQAGG